MKFSIILSTLALFATAVTALPAPPKVAPKAPASNAPPKAAAPGSKPPARLAKPGTTPSQTQATMKAPACKRNGGCKENLFVVYYKPLSNRPPPVGGFGSPRHWALFLTNADKIDDKAVGTIYQVIDDTTHASNLGIGHRENVAVTKAGSYDSSKLLGAMAKGDMDKLTSGFYCEVLLDDIAEHNGKPQNMKAKNLKNCQHWVESVVGLAESDRLLPGGSVAKVTAGPRF